MKRTFRENSIDHSSELSSIYFNLYETKDFSDVTLVLSDKDEFKVHRLVLANQSKFFRILFYENQFNEANKDRMNVEADPDAFERILEYIYSGIVELGEEIDQILTVLDLSRRFGLEKLEASIIEQICVELENFELVWNAAECLESEIFKTKCFKAIEKSPLEYFKLETFFKIKKDDLLELFKRETLKVTTFDKLTFLIEWLKANPSETKEGLVDVLNLQKLTNEQLSKLIPNALYGPEDAIKWITAGNQSAEPEFMSVPSTNFADDQNVINLEKVQILSGLKKEALISNENDTYCSGELIDNELQAVLDLGDHYELNHLTFYLKDNETNYHFGIFASNDAKSWSCITNVYSCEERFGFQDIFFPKVEARYIKFVGNFKCKNFTASFTNKPLEVKDGYIFKGSNVFQKTLVKFTPSPYNRENMFKEVNFIPNVSYSYYRSSDKTITFKFTQPFVLSSCRLLPWTYDGKCNSNYFSIYTIQIQNEDGILVEKKVIHKIKSWDGDWLKWVFSAAAIKGFEIRYSDNSNDEIKIMAFEAR